MSSGDTRWSNRNQRRLVCTRCGRHQRSAGRVIEEAERELSYQWCVECLDTVGPCAKEPERHLALAPEPEPEPQPVEVYIEAVEQDAIVVRFEPPKPSDYHGYRVVDRRTITSEGR